MPSLKLNIVLLFCAHHSSDSIVRLFLMSVGTHRQRCSLNDVTVTTMPTVLPSQLQSSIWRPPFPLAQTKIEPCMKWSDATFPFLKWKKFLRETQTHLALPASCHTVEESSLGQRSRSVHSPSIVLGNFIQFSPHTRLMIGSADLWTPGCRVDVDVARVERQSSCLHCIIHHSVQHTDPT